MKVKAALGCAAVLSAAMPATVALADITGMVALFEPAACAEAGPGRDALGLITGQASGSVPAVGVGAFFLYPDHPGSGSVVLRASLDADTPVLACADVPEDWAQAEPIEVDLLPAPASPVTGRVRFAAVAEEDGGMRLEVTVVTWPSVGLAPEATSAPCGDLGRADALREGLATLGLLSRWTTVTPDGTELGIVWSADHWTVGRTVGDDPVRQLAVEARYDGDARYEEDTMVRRRWTIDELGLGVEVMEALESRWFPRSRRYIPHAWPGLVTVDTQTTDGRYGMTVDDDGIHVEFWIEPKESTRARADRCVR